MFKSFVLIVLCSLSLYGCESNHRAPVVNLNSKNQLYPKNKKPVMIQKQKKVPPKGRIVKISEVQPQQTRVFPKQPPQKPKPKSKNPVPSKNKLAVKDPLPYKKLPWKWPVKGAILRQFKESSHAKGIDIGGSLGASIKAASHGTIVYSGNGLKGYGNLIIIKHDENFLSAYAHNQKLLVKEGERVVLGQEIAKMGQTDTDRVKLHFEIRYKGKPIDPKRCLP